jgi:hypothetical protein
LKKKIYLLVLFASIFTYQTLANLLALNSSLIAYGNIASPYLWITPTTYVATELGETFTININISNIDNLRAFEFKLGYNTTLLDVVQVAQGSFFPAPPNAIITKLETNETTGLVWVNISLSAFETPKSGSGTLTTITFTVTYAPSSPSMTWCALDLRESILYDGAMVQISHDSIDGLYFWKTMVLDPPGTGLLLDLTTQRGGEGPNASDGTFSLGEVVELIGHLTYDDEPVQQKLVSFEVRNPLDEVVMHRTAITDENGYARISFRIPFIPESVGTWTAISVGTVDSITIWDWISFIVESGPSVGGYATPIRKEHVPTQLIDIHLVVFAITVLSAMVVARRFRIVKIDVKH